MCSRVEHCAEMFCEANLQTDKLKIETATRELVLAVKGYSTKKDKQIRNAARFLYESEGAIEIDDNATVSISDDNGAYVAAWVWVRVDTKKDLGM